MNLTNQKANIFDIYAYIKEKFTLQNWFNPVRETITITLSTYPDYTYFDGSLRQFVRLVSIPQKHHDFFLRNMDGLLAPAPDNKHDTFFQRDVSRILREVGIVVVFVEPTAAP